MITVPYALQIEMLQSLLNTAVTLRLFANNVTPSVTTVAADLTEVSGGGYAGIALTYANWLFTNSSYALYNASQIFNFTGATGGTHNIYGYYITRDSDGHLLWAENFDAIPFTPVNGSEIAITPKITLVNQT